MKKTLWALPLSFCCLFLMSPAWAETSRPRLSRKDCPRLLSRPTDLQISAELRTAISRSEAQLRFAENDYRRSLLNLFESVGATDEVSRLIANGWPGQTPAGHSYHVVDGALKIETSLGEGFEVRLVHYAASGERGFRVERRKRDPDALVFATGPVAYRTLAPERLLAFKNGAMNFEAVTVLLDVLAASSRKRLRDEVHYYRSALEAMAELRRAYAENNIRALPLNHLGDKLNLVAEMLPYADRMIVGPEKFTVSSVDRRQLRKHKLTGDWLRIEEPGGRSHWLNLPRPREAVEFLSFDGRGRPSGSARVSASGLIISQKDWSAANASLIPSLLKVFYALGL